MNSGTGQGLRFENVQVGIDARGGGSGFFALIDSTATNTTMVVAEDQQQFTMGSLVLENVMVDATVPAVSPDPQLVWRCLDRHCTGATNSESV